MWAEIRSRWKDWMSSLARQRGVGEDARIPRPSDIRPRRATASGRPESSRARGQTPALKGLFYWVAVSLVWVGICFTALIAYYALDLPDTSTITDVAHAPGLTLRGAEGQVVARRGALFGKAVTLESLPKHLPAAVIATEDRRFYNHIGLDLRALARAIYANLSAGGVVQGGSTLTQQLAKNLFLSPDRTLKRKVQELLLALWLEQRFSKEEILSLYLNRVYFGAGAYGVDAAARRYFDKPAAKVTLSEAALLAGLLKAPSRFAPTNDLEAARKRANLVLQNMVAAGYISDDAAKAAKAKPARLAPYVGLASTNYVLDWLTELLPGYVGPHNGDITVSSTLDPKLQALAERIVHKAIAAEGGKLKVSQAALLAMTPDGSIRAMIGGVDYRESQFNRVTQAHRQPGSAFKPFIYLAALETGMGPNTIRFDAPVSIGSWSPKNYTPGYRGPVTLSEALSGSINTVAVRVMEEVGRDNVVRMASRLGVHSPMQSLPSLALGTEEVTLLELTTAYAVLANGGNGVFPHLINAVEDSDGEKIYERRGEGPGRVVSERAAGLMNDMLRATLTAGTGRAAALSNGRPAAGKTGTTQVSRDAWFIGYTADLVVGVWVGNDSGEPMNKVTGGGLPARIWRSFMEEALHDTPHISLPGWYEEPVAPFDIAASDAEIYDDSASSLPAGGYESERRGFLGRLFSRLRGRDDDSDRRDRRPRARNEPEYIYPEN
jgi:penicillin-binding protein 1A